MSNLNDNIILMTDSYKVSHAKQYQPGTTNVYSYMESRGGKFPSTVFFGLQYIIKSKLLGKVITKEKIDEAEEYLSAHFSQNVFNRKGWEYILEKYDGHLPLRIKAVPEGTIVPTQNVLMTIESLDPKCYWLTNYAETVLMQNWYPTTVATNSREIKKIIGKYMMKTAGNVEGLDFKLHDFGCRGASSMETAAIGSASHMVSFQGTDTIPGLVLLDKFYGCPMGGFSIPAAEHSTITSWGRENEAKACENMIDQFGSGVFAVVSDSYDIYNACSNIFGKKLKDKILNMDGTLVVRPDSGYPPEVVCEVLRVLGEAFGTRVNTKGYKVLNDKVRIIQGDGIDLEMVDLILDHTTLNGLSAENTNFGSGGALLQKFDRDTQEFAIKCSSTTANGKEIDVYKDPVTDSKKRSKRGRLALVKNNGKFETIEQCKDPIDGDLLETVFEHGKLLIDQSFEDIRKRAKCEFSLEGWADDRI